jgi:glutaredoxin
MNAEDAVGLALYLTPYCPYCVRVRRAIDELGVEVEERDISKERRFRDELVRARGRSTVPVLRISRQNTRDEWMPESADIVAYLKERFG